MKRWSQKTLEGTECAKGGQGSHRIVATVETGIKAYLPVVHGAKKPLS